MSPNFEQFLSKGSVTHLLVDTCVLIDLLIAGKETEEWLISTAKSNSVHLVGNEAILLELLKNSKSKKEYDNKAGLYLRIIEADLPLDINSLKAAQRMAIAYGKLGKGVSFTDFILAGALERYGNKNTYLLTVNHKDFPSKILDRKAVFSLEVGEEVRSFAIYGYSEDKYLARLKELGF